MFIEVDRESKTSLTRQIYEQLRQGILNQEIKGGTRLPSTRSISDETGVSRIIIVEAFEQLKAEGYLEGKKGSGTFVSRGLQLQMKKDHPVPKENQTPATETETLINFWGGIPDLSRFPRKLWAKMLRDATLECPEEYLSYPPAAGLPELRKVLADYLLRAKGIKCRWEQIMILSGSAQGIQLLGKCLTEKKGKVILEDPVYSGITRMYKAMNLEILPIPLDEKGIITEQLPEHPESDFLMVTPSHQHPSGTVLPIQRRIELVKYARKWDIPLVENDYDSEFRFSGMPISSIQSLDVDRVIHLGTMSESLFPSLRIGYMVLPDNLISPISSMMSQMSFAVPAVEQIALSYFIEEGYLERHISRMKRLYRKKRDYLKELLFKEFGDRIKISGDSTGLFFQAGFPERPDLTSLKAEAAKLGLGIGFNSDDFIEADPHPHRLIMGFGNLQEEEIEKGVALLKRAYDKEQ